MKPDFMKDKLYFCWRGFFPQELLCIKMTKFANPVIARRNDEAIQIK